MLDRTRTLFALGAGNVARVAAYRIGLRLGVHPVLQLRAGRPRGPFLVNNSPWRPGAVGTSLWKNAANYFTCHAFPLTGAPDWHANPFRPGARADSSKPWSEISDFDPVVGDIKAVWEPSRFDWLVAMAQRASLGNEQELARLNAWLDDWLESNPPYFGINWKCGQEASIRVMHLLLTALILGQSAAPLPALTSLVRLHLARIAPTMGYAIGQQNNHGVSEAAALFMGGSFLAIAGHSDGREYAWVGRRWLEDRASKLIEADGTFSQYSVTYHRFMLDTYSLAEVWRRTLNLAPFSKRLMERLRCATAWLHQMVEPRSGDAPNLGANDGARLMPLTDTGYRDFRPSLQLAAMLFSGARAIAEEGPWDQPAIWLGVMSPDAVLPAPDSTSLDCGGLHVLRRRRARVYLRYPRFRFRPSQADALHLDLWVDGNNLLRDGGTYSYHAEEKEYLYFSGTAAHNTVEFDGRDQMPRLGRFLYGSWLRAENVEVVSVSDGAVQASAGYRDFAGAIHHRAVRLSESQLICIDRVAGTAKRAVLRWRLQPGQWQRSGGGFTNGAVFLTVFCDRGLERTEIVQGFESREYLKKEPLPVLEAECEVPATLTTRLSF